MSRGLTEQSFIYTTRTLISITIKICIGLNAVSLPLWRSISFRRFSSNPTKVSKVIENAVDYSFLRQITKRRNKPDFFGGISKM